ncbi:MAG: hypothetical protein IPP74_14675 [Alphaproteobacteria bacterium]|nr:hypothetical protein [Alphaproteobacteria bacterium]
MNEEYLRQTKELVTSIQTRFLELGARLYKIHEEKLWEGSFDSYVDFLESARISESQASIFANIHKYYVLEGGIQEDRLALIGYSNLHQALPLIQAEGVESAVVKAQTLTREEIKDDVRGIKFGDEHAHSLGETRFAFCTECKKLVRLEEKDL